MADQRVEEIRNQSWPAKALEQVPACPVCGGTSRTLLHDQLWDATFLSAPGRWSLWECEHCRSAYLDPRPTPDTISQAYEVYYTHDDNQALQHTDLPKVGGGLSSRLRQSLSNGYRNWRYGSARKPSSRAGAFVGMLLPPLRRNLDFSLRYLPRITHARPKILDVGCGGGDWLLHAKEAGWDAYGAEPDPEAVALARKRALDVRQGGIETWVNEEGQFDAVTMNHVLEHLHDPRQVLSTVFKLLRPGGHLYMATPNICALGYLAYGANWRGLEAPRHLVLFNRSSLLHLLKTSGFVLIRERHAPSPIEFIISESRRIGNLAGPSGGLLHTKEERLLRWKSKFNRSRSEFLTFTCLKPL